MRKVKKWVVATILYSMSSVALADWDSATIVDEVPAGDFYTKCIYETLGGFRFSIIRKGLCPSSLEVNPETGQVKQR